MRTNLSTRSRFWRRSPVPVLALAFAASVVQAQGHITSPKEFFGFNIGDDYKLANYTQFMGYWQKIAKESNRAVLQEIGKSAEGRPQLMMIVSAPENLKKLDHYKEISRKLALAEGLTDQEAHALALEGESVVWIDGGLHALVHFVRSEGAFTFCSHFFAG